MLSKGKHPRPPDCGSGPLPRVGVFCLNVHQAPPVCPLRDLHAPGTPLLGQPGRRQDCLHGVIQRCRSLNGGPSVLGGEDRPGSAGPPPTQWASTTSAVRRAAPDGGHRLPHRGKTGSPPHQGREVFGDALYTLDAQPHGNPDKGGENHPELPCNRSGGGRTAIATEAGNGEPEPTAQEKYGHKRNLTRPHRSVSISQHALAIAEAIPLAASVVYSKPSNRPTRTAQTTISVLEPAPALC